MRRHLWLLTLATGIACAEPPAQPSSAAVVPTPSKHADPPPPFPPQQMAELAAWYEAVGSRRPHEPFGQLITRIAKVQLGKPYVDEPGPPRPEELRVAFDHFECVSFVETSLAMARCVWGGTSTAQCFAEELEGLRYRAGEMAGYTSRLHYFTEWMHDNSERRRIKPLSAQLGGRTIEQVYNFMTEHPQRYPPMSDEQVFADIADVESELSARKPTIIDRDAIDAAQEQLQTGDLIAFVGSKPGLLVTHAGFVQVAPNGARRVLHASSYAKRVLITKGDVASYVRRKPERRGIMAARPLPPE